MRRHISRVDSRDRNSENGPSSLHDNGLSALAGTWSEAEFEEFERATAFFGLAGDWPDEEPRP